MDSAHWQHVLVEYFTRAAKVLGCDWKKASEPKSEDQAPVIGDQLLSMVGEAVTSGAGLPSQQPLPQQNYSLQWYYEKHLRTDLSIPADGSPNLLNLYLGGMKDPTSAEAYRHKRDEGLATRDELLKRLDERLQAATLGESLNERQRIAVANGLLLPFSTIIGPPGTGKTKTIAALVALATQGRQTVAVVSTNHSAVQNAYEALMNIEGVRDKVALLGNSSEREKSPVPRKDKTAPPYTFHTVKKQDGRERKIEDERKGWESKIEFAEFTADYPIVFCTIHSLKKCFVDGALNRYDLLIMDESSQTDLIAGIVALSCAKRVVLVGDDEQLPPIYDHEALGLIDNGLDNIDDLRKSPWYLNRVDTVRPSGKQSPKKAPRIFYQDQSLLTSCKEVFQADERQDGSATATAPSTEVFLAIHYRCRFEIISFSRDEIYGPKLCLKEARKGIKADDTEKSYAIQVIWYQGDYCERIHPGGKTIRGKDKTSCINNKQIMILEHELGPQIAEHLSNGKTVCVLSPFREQTKRAKEALERIVSKYGLDICVTDGTIDERPEHDTSDTSSRSGTDSRSHFAVASKVVATTVQRAQGQEFDVVYLLPVEDGNWEWPFSQSRRLVNVAVTRAKEQLNVIVSTKMMSPELQEELTERVIPTNYPSNPQDDPTDQWMFVQRLVDYVWQRTSTSPPHVYALQPTSLLSIFDDVPAIEGEFRCKTAKKEAPAICVKRRLNKILGCRFKQDDLEVNGEVHLTDLRLNGESILAEVDKASALGEIDNAAARELKKFISTTTALDFVVSRRGSGEIVLAVEADGGYHRHNPDITEEELQPRRDEHKNTIMHILHATRILHDVVGQISDEVAVGDGKSVDPDVGTGAFVFLRLPSDGRTFGETDKLSAEINRSSGQHPACSKYTLEYLVAKQLKTTWAGPKVTIDTTKTYKSRWD